MIHMVYLTDTKLDFTFLPLFLHFIYANVTNYIFLRILLEKSCFDFNRLSAVCRPFPTISKNSVAYYVCSLVPLTLLTSAAALRFSTLALLAHSVYGLAHSLCSLRNVSWNSKMCSHCERFQWEPTCFPSSLETCPYYDLIWLRMT